MPETAADNIMGFKISDLFCSRSIQKEDNKRIEEKTPPKKRRKFLLPNFSLTGKKTVFRLLAHLPGELRLGRHAAVRWQETRKDLLIHEIRRAIDDVVVRK